MKFIKVMAIILAFGIIFAGCNMIEVNAERDRETIVAKVEDEIVTKGEVKDSITSTLGYYILNGYYPEDFATSAVYKEYYIDFVNDTLDAFVAYKVEEITAKQMGYFNFTEEERVEIDSEIELTLQTYIEIYATELSADEQYADKSEEEIRLIAEENIDTFFIENGYNATKQDIIYDTELAKAQEKLYNMTTSSVVVTEEEVKAQYDTYVNEAKAAYEDGSENIEVDATAGGTVYYVPENVRKAQHILIKIPDETLDEIDAVRESEGDEAANLLYEAALSEIYDAAYAAYQRAIAGEDFKLLMDELGEDSGMTYNDYYAVTNPTNRYMTEFAEGLFALDNIGDISQPIATAYGYHIIKYYGDVESGPISYDDVHDEIYDAMLSDKKNAYYDEQFEMWKAGMKIKTYSDRLFD